MITPLYEYGLTDGEQVTDRRVMNSDEARRLNQEADEATDGTWWWALTSGLVVGYDS